VIRQPPSKFVNGHKKDEKTTSVNKKPHRIRNSVWQKQAGKKTEQIKRPAEIEGRSVCNKKQNKTTRKNLEIKDSHSRPSFVA
jgi:hypothetical protein